MDMEREIEEEDEKEYLSLRSAQASNTRDCCTKRWIVDGVMVMRVDDFLTRPNSEVRTLKVLPPRQLPLILRDVRPLPSESLDTYHTRLMHMEMPSPWNP